MPYCYSAIGHIKCYGFFYINVIYLLNQLLYSIILEVYYMRAVITVVGKDTVGILAKVSTLCAEKNVNIIDVTQTVMQDLFCMIMLCEIDKLSGDFATFVEEAKAIGASQNLSVHVMHEEIFNSMHRI